MYSLTFQYIYDHGNMFGIKACYNVYCTQYFSLTNMYNMLWSQHTISRKEKDNFESHHMRSKIAFIYRQLERWGGGGGAGVFVVEFRLTHLRSKYVVYGCT